MCDDVTVYLGDALSVSAPMDISFYLLHPTLDRLYQAKVISRTFIDEKWESDYPYSNMYSDECSGHSSDDTIGFEVNGNTYTNSQMLKLVNPMKNELDYIYDNFDWETCQGGDSDLDDFMSMKGQSHINWSTFYKSTTRDTLSDW